MLRKKILVAPLDWGLGHATRCIPVINSLMKKDVNVEIGTNGLSYHLLKNEFPELKINLLPGIEIKYIKEGNFTLQMLRQLPAFVSSIKTENSYLFTLIQSERYDAVISDNRYGLHSDIIPSVLITHQLMLKTPPHLQILEGLLSSKLKSYIEEFDVCWVPDFEDENNLSGDLSHKSKLEIPVEFIGPLSRFNKVGETEDVNIEFDLLAIISGPEPQRTVFENLIEQQARKRNISTLIIKGMPSEKYSSESNLIKKINHAESGFMKSAVTKAKGIIGRAGYSTIMDLVALKKPALLIPTPGQTEQLYLSEFLKNRGYFRFANQNNFNLEDAFFGSAPPDFPQFKNKGLEKSVDNLLSNLK